MSTTKTKASLEQLNELKALKKAIVTGHEAVEGFVKSAKDKSRQALAEAILTGKKLARAKEILGFGSFTRWCKQEVPKISERTVQKYMSLYNSLGAKANHGAELPATSLRKAYIALGIITEDEATQASDGTSDQSTPVTSGKSASSVAAPAQPVTSKATSKPSLSAKLHIEQPKPSISKADVLSRPKYLVKELLLDIQSIIQTGSVPVSELRAAVLDPIEGAFKAHQTKPSKKGRK